MLVRVQENPQKNAVVSPTRTCPLRSLVGLHLLEEPAERPSEQREFGPKMPRCADTGYTRRVAADVCILPSADEAIHALVECSGTPELRKTIVREGPRDAKLEEAWRGIESEAAKRGFRVK